MYGVLAEDASDLEVLKVLIRRIANDSKVTIKGKPYAGCGDLLSKGTRGIQALHDVGISKLIICYDADDCNPEERYNEIVSRIIRPSKVDLTFCALVPVQEIEAWLLSDLAAVKKIFSSFRDEREIASPENLRNPKEFLEKILRRRDNKPVYTDSTYNSKIAQHIDLFKLADKCISAIPLFELVQYGRGNYPGGQDPLAERKKKVLATLRSVKI